MHLQELRNTPVYANCLSFRQVSFVVLGRYALLMTGLGEPRVQGSCDAPKTNCTI